MKVRLPAVIPHKPSPKQLAFLAFEGREALYGGAAGGGKTDALLMAALQYVDVPNYSAIILRRSYTDLSLSGAIMDRAHYWLGKGTKSPAAHWDRETHTYTFPSGAKLAFGYIATSSDRYRYQSAEFQYIGWDEVTEFPFEEDYTFMFSRLRRTDELAAVPLRMRSASNPIGVGMQWVKARFVDNPNPNRIFIPATFEDNEHIDREGYRESLKELPEPLQKALIGGDWTVTIDAAFPEFDPDIHVVDTTDLYIPDDWKRWEGMDWGTSNPTAWLAAALSPEGDILVHGEYYQKGLITRHASAILTLRHNWWGQPVMAYCDPSIKNKTGFGQHGPGETVHGEFNKNGVYLVPAVNDRIAGRVKISELLRRDPSRQFPTWHPKHGEFGAPKIFFSSTCRNVINQVRLANLAPIDSKDNSEAVDPYWESRHGHAVAALRYLVTSPMHPTERQVPVLAGGRSFRDWNQWNNWREV